MLADLHETSPGSVVHTDLCIIGAGIAGISLARQFVGSSHQVCLLESGGLDYEAAAQDLAAGENTGFDYYPLVDSRLRFFGGTTAIWGGRSALLDPIDFQKRSWVEHSGWPLDLNELMPWYQEARRSMGLSQHAVDEQLWRELRLPAIPFDPAMLRTNFWQFDDRHAPYSIDRCDDLRRAANIQILTHASVTRIQADRDGQQIREAVIQTPAGKRLTVRARYFIVAAGGIENARLLLASNDVHSQGLGNHSDCLGRYFMEHPHARGGRIVSAQSWRLLKLFARSYTLPKTSLAGAGSRVAASLRPGETLQEQAGILNTSFTLACRQHPDEAMFFGMRAYQGLKHQLNPTRLNRNLWLGTKRAAVWLHQRIDPLRPWLLDRLNLRGIYAVVRAEQAPNPDSRILLSRERDALGMPRTRLEWRFSAIDKHSVKVSMEVLDRELRRLQLGRVELAGWLRDDSKEWEVDPLVSSHAIGGYHHMGTTRMAADPKHGVVDAQCRVHHIDNLYVAGSSVFPTSGWANPTLTLVALSQRLGHHLRQRLSQELSSTKGSLQVAARQAIRTASQNSQSSN